MTCVNFHNHTVKPSYMGPFLPFYKTDERKTSGIPFRAVLIESGAFWTGAVFTGNLLVLIELTSKCHETVFGVKTIRLLDSSKSMEYFVPLPSLSKIQTKQLEEWPFCKYCNKMNPNDMLT